MRYGAILRHVYVQPILDKIPSHHLAGLDDAVLLREFSLGKELAVSLQLAYCRLDLKRN